MCSTKEMPPLNGKHIMYTYHVKFLQTHSHSILQVTVIDKWIVLEFPLANSEHTALMRLMTLPCGYPRESKSEYLSQDTGQLLQLLPEH